MRICIYTYAYIQYIYIITNEEIEKSQQIDDHSVSQTMPSSKHIKMKKRQS